MQRTIFLILSFFFLTPLFAQESLPRHMTPQEQLIWADYLRDYPKDRGTNPPSDIPRTPGEWEEAQGVVVVWTSYQSNLREIVRYAREHVTVYIVCSSTQSVQNFLTQGGVSLENIQFIEASFNSVWVRDFGPQSIYLSGTNELAFVDWVYNRPRPQDDLIPVVMSNYLDIPIYQMTQSPNRLVATGGNFMADGFDQGFSSKLILNENSSLTEGQVDNIAYSYMGITPYVKMNTLPYDGIHHIDMHIKLLDEETLLVGEYPTGIADGPQIEANLNYVLENFETPYGRPYKVVRIPMPSDEYGRYPSNGSDYLTYTNSVILNELVLVPIYNRPQDDEALEIYREAMPGYRVVGIDMRNVIPASGAIHCITHEIAAYDPIFIAHATHQQALQYSPTGYTIEANIESAQGIANAQVYWSIDTTAGFTPATMQALAGNSYVATIPELTNDTRVFYYISATNENEKTITKPLVAPLGLYSFDIGNVPDPTYTLTINIQGQGQTNPTPGTYEYTPGSTLSLTATADQGWLFDRWEVNGTTYSTAELEVTILGNTLAIAYFTEDGNSSPTMEMSMLTLYPNPTQGTLRIGNPEGSENGKVVIYNAAGRVAMEEPIHSGNVTHINAQKLPAGVYIVKIATQQRVWSGRFVKI